MLYPLYYLSLPTLCFVAEKCSRLTIYNLQNKIPISTYNSLVLGENVSNKGRTEMLVHHRKYNIK